MPLIDPTTGQPRVDKVDLFRGRPKGGKGLLFVDNTVSGGTRQEIPTLTCGHCNCVVLLNPMRTRDRGHCRRCNAYLCDKPGCRAECNPTEEGLDLALAAKPGEGEAFVGRAPDGGILFDPRVRDRRRPH